jgi:hypothetical protein
MKVSAVKRSVILSSHAASGLIAMTAREQRRAHVLARVVAGELKL